MTPTGRGSPRTGAARHCSGEQPAAKAISRSLAASISAAYSAGLGTASLMPGPWLPRVTGSPSNEPGVEEVAQRRPIDGKQDRAPDGVTRERALLPAQGGLITEELARSEPQHRLISPVAFGADLDLPVDHNVVLAGRFTRAKDNLAGFISQSVENGRNPAARRRLRCVVQLEGPADLRWLPGDHVIVVVHEMHFTRGDDIEQSGRPHKLLTELQQVERPADGGLLFCRRPATAHALQLAYLAPVHGVVIHRERDVPAVLDVTQQLGSLAREEEDAVRVVHVDDRVGVRHPGERRG